MSEIENLVLDFLDFLQFLDWIHYALIGILYFVVGIILGLVYFSGLWITLKRLTQSSYFAGSLMISFILRIGFLMIVFFFILTSSDFILASSNGSSLNLLIALLGFVAARAILMRKLLKNPGLHRASSPEKKEV